MRLISRLHFQTKIGLGIFLIVLAVALMTAIPVSRMAARAIIAESRGRGLVLAENLSLRLADAMLTQDFLRMKNMVDELTGVGEDVVYAFVLDEAGDVLAHTFQKGFPVEHRRINAGEGTIGKLVKDDMNFEKTVKLLETYFKLGGLHFQLTYVAKEDLKKAKVTPQQYKGLRVRGQVAPV